MKKILTLILVSLSSLGIFATANQVFALKPVEAGMYVYYETQDVYYEKVVKADFIYPSAVELTFENGSKTTVESYSEEKLQYDSFGLRAVGGKMITVHDSYGEELDEVIAIDFPQPDVVSSYKLTFVDGTVKTFLEYETSLQDSFWIKFNVSGEDLRPAINGQENFASNVDSPTTVQQMISQLRAIDDIDGDISHKIVIEKDNFTANKNILGRYDVDVSVTDSAGNKTEFKFWVTVADITSPVASADLTPKVISYDKTLDFESLKNTITATDNYYSFSELTITMTRDTYTTNKTKLGTYYVDYTVEDPSANKTVLTFPIVVKDLVAPVINGISELTKSYTNIMPLSEILNGITATDAIDGDLTNKITVISDTYTGNANKPGNYVVTIQVADNSGNKTTRDIKIKVIDDKGADWYITNNVTFNLPSDTPMTRAQIIDLLTRAGQVQASSLSRVIYSADTYTGNETEPGIYTLAFNVQEPNGNEKAYTYAINVFSTSDEDIDVVPTPPNFIDKSKQFFNENKVSIIAGAVFLALSAFVIVKVKEEVKKNKRKRK